PLPRLAEQLLPLVPGDVDPEGDLVLRLIHLVDEASDEALPFRDEGHEVEGREGLLHGTVPKRMALLIDAAGRRRLPGEPLPIPRRSPRRGSPSRPACWSVRTAVLSAISPRRSYYIALHM